MLECSSFFYGKPRCINTHTHTHKNPHRHIEITLSTSSRIFEKKIYLNLKLKNAEKARPVQGATCDAGKILWWTRDGNCLPNSHSTFFFFFLSSLSLTESQFCSAICWWCFSEPLPSSRWWILTHLSKSWSFYIPSQLWFRVGPVIQFYRRDSPGRLGKSFLVHKKKYKKRKISFS